MIDSLRRPSFPMRDLELASYLSRRRRVMHNLSASECETLTLAELLELADAEDRARWEGLRLGYTDPLGASWLREAAAAGYNEVGPQDLVCFAGAQEALYATVHALLTPGDHAIVLLPCYQSIETLTLGLCDVTGVALDEARGWAFNLDAVAAAIRPATRAVLINFPNNPTGKHLEHAQFDALVALCRQHGLWLVSDEVYRGTERDLARCLPQAADAYERGISLGVLSKAYGLPGLRIGWVACRSAELRERLARLRQYLSTCCAGPSEVLATIALKAGERIVARNRVLAEANLQALLAFFGRHPALFACEEPEGGVVCYPRWKGPGDVEAFTARMGEEGVLLLPASVFRSDLLRLPPDRFRIGYGGRDFGAGLAVLEEALSRV